MAPKAKAAAAAASSKKAKEAAPAKASTKNSDAPAKKAGKATKEKEAHIDITASPTDGAPAVDQDELEEAADEAAAASSGSSNDAALAAASGSGEMSASFKNFRHHPDMENFYRFIFENDLRHEALGIIDKIMLEKIARRTQPKAGKAGH